MKIKDLRTHIISAPLEKPFEAAVGWIDRRDSVIVEVETADGTVGFGECQCFGRQEPFSLVAIIENGYKPLVIGEDIFDVEVIWEKLYAFIRPNCQQGISIGAQSGIDIAIYDAMGKILGQPVYNLLGGRYRDRIHAYATGFYRYADKQYPEASIEEARRHIENGFHMMKLKCGFGVDQDLAYIRAVRKALGYDVKLMADFNGAYSQANARRILFETEELKLEFLEEPMSPEDMAGYIALRNLTGTAIAAGECLTGKRNFMNWLEHGALDIYQPSFAIAGGFTECKKIAVLTQVHNCMLIPQIWGSGICLAAALQFIATLVPTPLTHKPMEPVVEYDQSRHPFRMELIGADDIRFENGDLIVPSKPGIGVEVNRKVLEKFEIKK